MLRHAQLDAKYQDACDKVTLGFSFLIPVFWLIHIILWDYNIIEKAKHNKVVDSKTGITATYVTMYLVAALCAGITNAFSGIKAKRGSISLQVSLRRCHLTNR